MRSSALAYRSDFNSWEIVAEAGLTRILNPTCASNTELYDSSVPNALCLETWLFKPSPPRRRDRRLVRRSLGMFDVGYEDIAGLVTQLLGRRAARSLGVLNPYAARCCTFLNPGTRP